MVALDAYHLKMLEQESIEQRSQLDLFSTPLASPDEIPAQHPAITMLDDISPDELSPRQALEKLYLLKGISKNSDL